ncbi:MULTISPECIES: DUF2780 domain-containing protein [Vibrio]|jgi:hypothetical protein|uniref:DUF2780 domain-containing protein n=1 Tax=Vibrio diazotrophicus TaxID=685 RepID=A0A2J8H3D7_VIBDI|nr:MULTISPECIES: DUF2780 domain-containing protein [Vibrio]MCF7363310.1 DUF2780 domain-containing protein [Vibrio sp. A1-b2]PNH92759.1 hypothetical protein C1M59_09190 [Vibrio diazotrophicus]PNI04549.1 hypothetical protein C1N32_11735 [Vibrio diazotrophicus]
MKKSIIVTVLASTIFTAPSYAFLSKLSESNDLSSMVSSTLSQTESNSALLTQITSQLPVSQTQAAGGVGSLLALAQNQLSDSNSSELETLLPGLNQLTSLSESSSAIAKIADMEAVNNVFNKLGLDSSMVSQFAPLVLQYLTSQGASSDLLGSLSSLWQ